MSGKHDSLALIRLGSLIALKAQADAETAATARFYHAMATDPTIIAARAALFQPAAQDHVCDSDCDAAIDRVFASL